MFPEDHPHYVNHRHTAPSNTDNYFVFYSIIMHSYSPQELKRIKHLASCGMDVHFDEDDGA